jgi:predicted ATP-dependent endonuclease of OLD family
MYLRTLYIQGFKCFGEPFAIELHDGLNVLVGENGAGKTGVISAIRQLFNDSEGDSGGKLSQLKRSKFRRPSPTSTGMMS